MPDFTLDVLPGFPGLSFRPATDGDIDALLQLREATMAPHQRRAGAPSDAQTQLGRVTYRLGDAQVVLDGADMVGLFKAYRSGPREWMLVQVQIAPSWQGRGLGAALIRQLLDCAGREGGAVVLDVLKGNPARKLYERMGFVAEEERELSHLMRWVGR